MNRHSIRSHNLAICCLITKSPNLIIANISAFTVIHYFLLQLKSSPSTVTAEPKLTSDCPHPPAPPKSFQEGDVQKKITPWTNPGSVAVELFPGSSSTILTGVQHPSSLTGVGSGERGGMVLVASLLNKIPNLGGEKGCLH